jgi:HEAT repeat protein
MSTISLYARLSEITEAGQSADRAEIEMALTSADPYLVWMGCKAAGLTGSDHWASHLRRVAIERYPGNEPDLNSIAIWALAKIDGNAAEDFWREMSLSESANARRAAADLIGEMKADRGLTTLSRLLGDADPEVASWAALSAAKLGQISIPVLEVTINATSSERIFLYCADALLKIGKEVTAGVINSALSRWPLQSRTSLEQAIQELKRRN